MVDDANIAVSEDYHMDNTDNIPLPDHVTCIIQPDTSVENFLDVVQSSFRKHLQDSDLSNRSNVVSDSQNSNQNVFINSGKEKLTGDSQSADNSYQNESVNLTKENLKGDNLETKGDFDVKSDRMECVVSSDDCLLNFSVQFIMTGLHACGDLTATMIRVYSKCPDIIGLASVSCCYIKLTCEG